MIVGTGDRLGSLHAPLDDVTAEPVKRRRRLEPDVVAAVSLADVGPERPGVADDPARSSSATIMSVATSQFWRWS